jgi:hypothetical protein
MQIQRLGPNSFVQKIRGSFVQQIETAKDAEHMFIDQWAELSRLTSK